MGHEDAQSQQQEPLLKDMIGLHKITIVELDSLLIRFMMASAKPDL